MELLNQIQDLSLNIQVINGGYYIIPFLNKLLIDDIYKFTGKIMGNKLAEATIILDCKYDHPTIYLPDDFDSWIEDFRKYSNKKLVLNLSLCNVYKNYGHSNLLIIDSKLKRVERFE